MRTILSAVVLLAACAEQRPPDPAPSATPSPASVPTLPSPAAMPTPAALPSAAAAVLTAEGWGPLTIGMTRAAVVAARGDRADPDAVGEVEPDACDLFHPARAPERLFVMIEQGKLTRVTLAKGAALATDRGLGLGATAAQVRAAYGNALKAEPHEYVPAPAQYLTHWAKGGGGAYVQDPAARGVRYEVGADGRVEAIHAGGPSIQYVEGCS